MTNPSPSPLSLSLSLPLPPSHLDECEDCSHDGLLVLKASLLPQDTREEVHEGPLLGGKLDAQRSNSLRWEEVGGRGEGMNVTRGQEEENKQPLMVSG